MPADRLNPLERRYTLGRFLAITAACASLAVAGLLMLTDDQPVVERVPPDDRLEYEIPATINGTPATCDVVDKVTDGVRTLSLIDCTNAVTCNDEGACTIPPLYIERGTDD